MMRIAILTIFATSALIGCSADKQSPEVNFQERISTALTSSNGDEKRSAVSALFYQVGLDEETKKYSARSVEMLMQMSQSNISFEPLPAEVDFLHIVNGYEIRPNLQPIGMIVLTEESASSGNNTKLPYAQKPGSDDLIFPSTIRRLVKANAAADKQLQIIAVGMANPPPRFSGWCDILLSDGSTRKMELSDQGVGNQTRVIRGQAIRSCSLTGELKSGWLKLTLMEDQETIFEKKVNSPDSQINFR